MAEYKNYYINDNNKTSNVNELQLLQLLRLVHDGDLLSKIATKELHSLGFVTRQSGFNIINEKGIEYLNKLKLICS